MTVITRFAPSPTGLLHIGGARPALFNWLYARHHGGKYLLRVEDTDRARSTEAAVAAIFDGLDWLGLTADAPPLFQSARAPRHAEIAAKLLAAGRAYRCYCTPEELEEMRAAARANGQPMGYDGRWRDRPASEAPEGVAPVIRLKMPRSGSTVIQDLVQGRVETDNVQLDDFVLLRADGTPTYMLSVVVDDHDMGVTHVIRGSDHLTNAFRQYQLYAACDWAVPAFAHIPLIHGADGAKLSKRHGALGVEAYRDMGYLPEALANYLLRLGWAHGDAEIISREEAISWFDLDAVGRSPARFDPARLDSLNGHYLREADDARLLDLIAPKLPVPVDTMLRGRLLKGMQGLKQRARNLVDLADAATICAMAPALPPAEPKAAKLLEGEAPALLHALADSLSAQEHWTQPALEDALRAFAEARGLGFGKLAQPARAALTGRGQSPGLFEVMEILGQAECLSRLRAVS